MSRILSFLLWLSCHALLVAQGPHFSMPSHPLANPANFGSASANYEGRLQLNYRNQWSAVLGSNAYKTATASYDQRLGLAKNDFLGLGFTLSSDRAGSAGYAHNAAGLGASLLKHLAGNRSRNTYLTAGVSGAFNQRSIDNDKVLFADQLSFGTTDETLPLASHSYFDLGLGAQLWSSPKSYKYFQHAFRLGGSIYHINKPTVGFRANQSVYRMPVRLRLEASGIHRISPPAKRPVFLVGSVVWQKQGPIQQLRIHTQGRFDLRSYNDNTWIQFGLAARLNNNVTSHFSDALILDFTVQLQSVQLGLYYDYTLSPLARSTGAVGSFELAVQYFIPFKIRRSVHCPNF